jgi:hypothetical protein
MVKKCFKCKKIKPIDQFYLHKRMADGHLNKCKKCFLDDCHKRYFDPVSRKRIIEYEKKRARKPLRKLQQLEYQRKRRNSHKGKDNCRNKLNNALRDGRIKKAPCKKCGNIKVEGHHPDYRSPLKVIWLCRKHHLEIEGRISFYLTGH